MATIPSKQDKRKKQETVRYVKVSELRPESSTDSCLRPLGLCELGGCCDVCFYGPNHPAQNRKKDE